MRTASRGALATCGHVSQLSTLWHRDRGLGIHPHIFGPRVYAFAKTITHQPRLYNNRLPQARAAVDRYFTLPTTPTRTGVALTPASFHNGTHLARSNVLPIQQTSIIRVKQAVGRLLGTYNFPNTPGFASQVGFGTVRSFHSSQTPIRKFAENAPISLRAFAEADWELRTKGKRPAKMTERKETPEVKKTKEMVKPIENKAQSISKTQVESDHHSAASPAEATANPPSLSPPHGLGVDIEERAEPKAERKKRADAETRKEREFRKNGESLWVLSQTVPSLQITGRGYEIYRTRQHSWLAGSSGSLGGLGCHPGETRPTNLSPGVGLLSGTPMIIPTSPPV